MGAVAVKEANIVSFHVVKKEEPKKKRDGNIKNTVNNNSKTRFVEPIREKDDVKRIYDYLMESITNSKDRKEKISNYKKAIIWTIGTHNGFRVVDLLQIKYSDIFSKNGEFKIYENRKEQKTGKYKGLIITDKTKNLISNYIVDCNIKYELSDYLFSNPANKEKHLSDTWVGDFIKEITKQLGIKGNYYTHTLRKTFAYQYFVMLSNNEADKVTALVQVQHMLNHANQQLTLRYLGLEKQDKIEKSERLSDWLDF